MKKLISILGISTILLSSATTLVSCSSVGVYSSIYVITDAGKVADKSFNQSGYEAGNRFINEALLVKDTNVSYAQPTTMTDAPWMYNQAFKHGAKTIILPGYKHGAFINDANNAAKKFDGSVVFIDGSSNQMDNTIGLSYRSDISGLWAGISSIMYILTTNQKPVLATFGGMQNAAAVDPFMAGFLASVEVYNQMIDSPTLRSSIQKVANSFGVTNKQLDLKAEINSAQKDGYSAHGQWFTDSFDPGKGSDLSETLLIQKGANVIMPVAGPQTADALKVLSENNLEGKSFVVGVDTDQVEMYKTFSKYFITSAEKDIVGSSSLALAHSGMFETEMNNAKEKLRLELESYNNILREMGNNLSITTKVGDDFENVKIGLTTDEKENNWNGRDFWVGGSISISDSNKVHKPQLEALKEIFEKAATNASINYFAYTSNPGKGVASETLSIKTINKYSDDIINYLNNPKTNYGDFLAT